MNTDVIRLSATVINQLLLIHGKISEKLFSINKGSKRDEFVFNTKLSQEGAAFLHLLIFNKKIVLCFNDVNFPFVKNTRKNGREMFFSNERNLSSSHSEKQETLHRNPTVSVLIKKTTLACFRSAIYSGTEQCAKILRWGICEIRHYAGWGTPLGYTIFF